MRLVEADREQHDDVGRGDDRKDREREQEQHAARLAARPFLVLEEVH